MIRHCVKSFFRTWITDNIQHGLLFVVFFAVLFSTYSCIEDPTELGVGLLPETDFFDIHTIDTLSISSYNVSYGVLNTSQPEFSFLGTGYDPYFGDTEAEFVTQLRLSSSQYSEEFTYEIDSVTLYLKLENLTGSGTGPHYISFYEIADEINRDSTYFSDTELSYTGMAVTRLLLPELSVAGETSIKLTVPNSFGEYLVREPANLTHTSDSLSFYEYFKGLHFKLESPGDKAFLTLSIDPPATALDYSNYFVLYLKDTEDDTKQELKFIMDATNENAHFNLFENDLTAAEHVIEHLDDGYPDTMAYIDRWGSVSTKVVLSDIETLKNNPVFDGITITKARLIFPAYFDGDYYTVEDSPNQLLLKYFNSDGTTNYVHDFESVSSNFYSGGLNDDGDAYVFNIPSYVQAFLDDDTDYILPELEITMLQSSSNSAILKANNSFILPAFEFSYIK